MKIKKIKSKIKNLRFGKNCTVMEPSNIYGSKFGKNVFIGPFVEIQKNSHIGDNTRVQSHSFICEKVFIGTKCFISHGVMFINDLAKALSRVSLSVPYAYGFILLTKRFFIQILLKF